MKNKFLQGFKEGMKNFGTNLSTIVNSLLLLLVYIVGVGPTSIIAKVFKKNFLDKELKEESYWSELNLSKKSLKEYYRQF